MRGHHSAGALLAAVLLAACGPSEQALEEELLLHPGGDVLAAGDTVRISESVPGDAMLAGRRTVFDGSTGGSYVGAGGEVDVGGRVEGSVRAAGSTVRLTASVGRNATLVGGTVRIERAAGVERNAYLAGGTVRLEGTVAGDAYVGGREVVLDGFVGGDVRVEAERLVLGPDARLGGDLRYRTADGTVDVDPDARVAGSTLALPPREEDDGPGDAIAFLVFRLLAFLATGTAVVALFPRAVDALGERLGGSVGPSFGFGLAAMFVVPLAVVLTAATVVGLPLAAISAVLFAIALYLAPIVPAIWLGGAILGRGDTPRASSRGAQVQRFSVGGAIVGVAILLPWVGMLARLVAVALGLGALWRAWSGRDEEAEAAERA